MPGRDIVFVEIEAPYRDDARDLVTPVRCDRQQTVRWLFGVSQSGAQCQYDRYLARII
jgi:hypothetical protein